MGTKVYDDQIAGGMSMGTTPLRVRRRGLAGVVMALALTVAACGGDDEADAGADSSQTDPTDQTDQPKQPDEPDILSYDGGEIPGSPDAEFMDYGLVTDCVTEDPEEFCGETLTLDADGRGTYLPGGDIMEEIVWRYQTDEIIEVLRSDNTALELQVQGAELHEVGSDRVYVPSEGS